MNEYFDISIKIIVLATQFAACSTAFLAYNRAKSPNNILKKYKLDEHFSLSQEILNNNAWRTVHDLTLEMWFFGSSGKRMKADEIRFFLDKPAPLDNLIDYLNCRSQMNAVRDQHGGIIGFTPNFQQHTLRGYFLNQKLQNIIFFISMMYTGLSFAFAPTIYKLDPAAMTISLMYAVPMGLLALISGAQVSKNGSTQRISSQFAAS